MSMTPSNEAPDGERGRSSPGRLFPTACLSCRAKHLKCDRLHPCIRCTASGDECSYVASRRGYKRARSRTPPQHLEENVLASLLTAQAATPLNGAFSSASSSSGAASSAVCSIGGAMGMDLSSPNLVLSAPTPLDQGLSPHPAQLVRVNDTGFKLTNESSALSDRYLNSYYQNFHASHPFTLPKKYLFQFTNFAALEPLLCAIRWVGSLYVDRVFSRGQLLEEAYRKINDPNTPQDGLLVQAMLVLIVGLDGTRQLEAAKKLLADAGALAVKIGLNSHQFAIAHGRDNAVVQESWRRTWWDLYVVDGMIAGVHRATNFALFDVQADVQLPCEEWEYQSGVIPTPKSLADLESYDFSDSDLDGFSSFSYRILCARNLGRFFRCGPIVGPDDPNLSRMEALLTHWRLNLPNSKKDPVAIDGTIDEMMFQAHMMINASSILVHYPHSQLNPSATKRIDSCAPSQPVTPGFTYNSHTRHVISAANEISKLITPSDLLCHTPFFVCVVSNASIVHINRWGSYMHSEEDDVFLRQQISLNIGALNRLSQVWESARAAKEQIRSVAQEISQSRRQEEDEIRSGLWSEILGE
uniref:Zn(2)-C6 fungal-type domain-containing protein n=2 Tax=Bionectria ochroleuca TaxID=29856 RepID=A0A8H7K7W3_BIOOC